MAESSQEKSSYEEDTDTEIATVLQPQTVLMENQDYSDSNTDTDEGEPLANLKTQTDLRKNLDNSINSSTDSEEDKPRKKAKLHKNITGDDDVSNSNTEEDEPLINMKLKTELSENDDDDNDVYAKFNVDNDEIYETESENSMSADCEPKAKRSYPVRPELDVKKRAYIKSAQYIYGKFIMRQCPMCEFEFNSAHCWKKHLNFMHRLEKPEHLQFKYNERGAKCKLCDFQTATPSFNKLLDHEISHMPNSHYLKCKLCEWKTKTHSSMNFHLRAQHAETIDVTTKSLELTVCPYCNQEFASQWYLRKHLIQEHERTVDERTSFLCLECGEEFRTNTSLRAHVYEKFAHCTPQDLGFIEVPPAEGDKDNTTSHLKCTQCPQIFRRITARRTRVNIAEHYMLHLGEPSGRLAYKCRYCDESFRRYDNMRLHICETLKNVLKNGLASWTEGSNQARLRRRKAASKQKIPVEPVANKRDYMRYIRFVCLRCGMSFGKNFQCKKHMFDKHAMNQPAGLEFKKVGRQDDTEIYECTVCEEFTCDFDLNTMLVHARTHTIYDPFQCKLCQMTFAYDADIPGHECVDEESAGAMRGNKPFKENTLANMESFCPKCGQTYTAPSSLTRHMYKAHGMDEPYGLGFEVATLNNGDVTVFSCTQCVTFTVPDKNLRAMLEHARQHLPYKSFRCTLCNERFQLKTEAKLHQCANESNDTTATPNVDELVYQDKNAIKERLNKMGRFCPKCGKKFIKTFVCKRHMSSVHGLDKPSGTGFEKIGESNTSYRCIACLNFTLDKPDVSLMLEHAREHLPFDSFWCMLCEGRFRTKVEAKQHRCANAVKEIENSTRTNIYPKTFEKCIRKFCPECNNEMPSIKTWRWHMAKYHELNELEGLQMKQTNANLVECLICQMHITNKRRQEHRFIHLPYKPLQCKFCFEYFMEIDKAKMHCYECERMPAELPTTTTPTESNRKEKVQKTITAEKNKIITKQSKDSEEEAVEESANKVLKLDVIEGNKAETTAKLNKKQNKKEKLHKTSNVQEESAKHIMPLKGISVVLTDDNDYAKFVRISCPLCADTEFETNIELTGHFHEVHNSFLEHFNIHNTNAANCKSCNKYFNTIYKKTLVRHYLGEINATCYCCRLCDKSFLYFNTMRTHLLDEHEAIIAGQSKDNSATMSSSSLSTAAGTSTSSSSVNMIGLADGADPLKLTNKDISQVSRTTMAIRTNKTAVFNEFNAYISYACPACNELFDTAEQWHLHINGEHDFFEQHQLNIEATSDGYKRCKQCNVNICGGVLAEQRHKLTHMKHKSFICTLCLHRSTTLGVLTQHFRRRHFAKGSFKCLLCEEVLSTSCAQNEHLKRDHTPDEYPRTLCRICFNNFSSVNALNTHMELHNPNRVLYQCKYCERTYKYRREYGLHMQSKHPGMEILSSDENF
ncbi:zinc finger protein Xfin-like isoform X2 [Eurosta solidaginis]|uniref:zinc finger protein Xfin-like isoform X2 n=1 Tax=Eurosta solidaginis TaxID=178769 RepID=UPI003530E560